LISTESDLCARLGIDNETQAIAAQTMTVKRMLRAYIINDGAMRVLSRGADGKGIDRSGECFERIYKEPLMAKAKK
jgi:hypothetical protein